MARRKAHLKILLQWNCRESDDQYDDIFLILKTSFRGKSRLCFFYGKSATSGEFRQTFFGLYRKKSTSDTCDLPGTNWVRVCNLYSQLSKTPVRCTFLRPEIGMCSCSPGDLKCASLRWRCVASSIGPREDTLDCEYVYIYMYALGALVLWVSVCVPAVESATRGGFYCTAGSLCWARDNSRRARDPVLLREPAWFHSDTVCDSTARNINWLARALFHS